MHTAVKQALPNIIRLILATDDNYASRRENPFYYINQEIDDYAYQASMYLRSMGLHPGALTSFPEIRYAVTKALGERLAARFSAL